MLKEWELNMSAVEMVKQKVFAGLGAVVLSAATVLAAAAPAGAIETAPRYAASQAADRAQA
ncbi:hypothetical protein [Sphingosinicella rhizophila]|uniref:Uncharacterized protein n=1 Tax=Sphingosinicella rhizophila TaxID=3050082 RepID=A0ABU3Q2C9_9SPHN|nr:hypothetical protein [Sphingosinicella sp. GR2756]MDT9597562.1 hypothetical protein [Sphingosinicella sp. GR2756]